jgi:hypothetical protein
MKNSAVGSADLRPFEECGFQRFTVRKAADSQKHEACVAIAIP